VERNVWLIWLFRCLDNQRWSQRKIIDEGLYLRSKVHCRFVLQQAGILEQVEVMAIRCLLAYVAQSRKQTAVSGGGIHKVIKIPLVAIEQLSRVSASFDLIA
jgi:hypothetical protein